MRFLDTNILVYGFDDRDPRKQAIAEEIVRGGARSPDIVISTQVLQEFFWIASRKYGDRLAPGAVHEAVREFARFRVVQVIVPIILAATTRVQTASISFWDALIVESALAAGATRLLTEDLQHGQVFDGALRVENPFR